MRQLKKFMNNLSGFWAGDRNRMMVLFGIEGLLFQFVMSLSGVSGFGTNLYATNLGATDSQLGMIQLVANLTAVVLLLPMGIISDRLKSSKTMPVVTLLFLGVSYMFYGSVPAMGANRMTFFFIFVALTAGVLAIYNAVWQAFFGDVTSFAERNSVYAFRNRFVFLISAIAPILCGTILTAMPDSESKLMVLRVFFYLCGVFSLINAFVLSRIKGGKRTPEMLAQIPKFSIKDVGSVLVSLSKSRKFIFYFICIMFFYMGWHLDWSMWYIGQTQYMGMSEAQISFFVAACSVLQLLTMGIFVRFNERKGVHFTFLFCILSLVSCPAAMIISGLCPAPIRPMMFMTIGTIVCIPQSASNLCLVQMLLEVTPEKNRSLVVSLNMAFVTLSNAIMSFLGVQLYNALGANYNAFLIFNGVTFALRVAALVIFIFRYKNSTRASALQTA